MKIDPVFSKGQDPYESVTWGTRRVEVKDSTGKVLFSLDAEFPTSWSDRACEICAYKYFRKDNPRETSLKQVVHRMAWKWTRTALEHNYIGGALDAEKKTSLYKELVYMLLHQMAAPNSPQWFNTGVDYYNTKGPDMNFVATEDGETVVPCLDTYRRPQVHACFIQSVDDSLVGPNSIMDLWEREAGMFKFGSGTGTNFSNIRSLGEPLRNGGESGGLMPWLKIGDVAAGAIKSGGTTRKAAKMVCLDVDHPEVLDFIHWKVKEELKVMAMVEGDQFHMDLSRHGVLPPGEKDFYEEAANRVRLRLDYDFNGEAYHTVSGQNSNNSIRIPDDFMFAVASDLDWALTSRTSGRTVKVVKARKIWDEIAWAAWMCADPGVQFHDNINAWNTCPNDGPIRASNPCSEYMFLDDTACNLASINLNAFLRDDKTFMYQEFLHAVRVWTLVLDVSVSMASYPSEEIAKRSMRYRTLGLGYANLGAMLMRLGLPYDSMESRQTAAEITAIMTAQAYITSHELARDLGPFPAYERNRDGVRGVIDKHASAAEGLMTGYRNLCDDTNTSLAVRARQLWRFLTKIDPAVGVRNAQISLLAPTGTIAFVMDCDTTGMEPDFSLVKHKKMAGGGSMVYVNHTAMDVLKAVLGEKDGETVRARLLTGDSLEKALDLVEIRPEKKDHIRKVLATANEIDWTGHLEMMGAIQPFLSGAISKTVNLPNSATVEDIQYLYVTAHKLGLKAVAVYRDGCKQSQPMNTVKKNKGVEFKKETKIGHISETVTLTIPSDDPAGPEPRTSEAAQFARDHLGEVRETISPQRRKLPSTRKSVTHNFRIGQQGGYITVGLYEDGSPGEIFIRINKAGSTLHGMMENFGRSISMGLQYGVPLQRMVESFSHQTFEPSGITDNKDIPFCQSIIDYTFRWIGKEFLQQATTAAVEPTVKVEEKKATGEICRECGTVMVRSGTCHTCPKCGSNSGCS